MVLLKLRLNYFWILHYAIVKKNYRKRHKHLSSATDNFAFACLLFLIGFIFMVFVDKDFLWDLIRKKRLPFGPIVRSLLFLLTPLLLIWMSGRLTKEKIGTIRKVIGKTKGIKRANAISYVSLFAILFISSFIILLKSRTPYNGH